MKNVNKLSIKELDSICAKYDLKIHASFKKPVMISCEAW